MNPKLIFYDPIYQKIVIDDKLIKALIFTSEFQRLKNINQLGMLSILRDWTRYTRFSHCLGVYHLLDMLFQKEIFRDISDQEKTEVKIAGLLHDLGHGPFSHTFEKLLPGFAHEQYSRQLIQDSQGEIFPLLKKHNLNVERICNLILNHTTNDWGQKIISGQFDFDRLDYLIRDCHFTGWQLNLGSANRLIDNLQLINHELVFDEKAILYVENYLIFRFYIYKQLFWNHKNLLLEGVLKNIFIRLRDLRQQKTISFDCAKFQFLLTQTLPSLNAFRHLDDHDLFTFLKELQLATTDHVLRILIAVILKPTAAYEELFSADAEVLQHFPTSEHKYFTYSSNREIVIYRTGNAEIKFINANQEIKKLSEISLFFNESKIYQKKLKIYLKTRF